VSALLARCNAVQFVLCAQRAEHPAFTLLPKLHAPAREVPTLSISYSSAGERRAAPLFSRSCFMARTWGWTNKGLQVKYGWVLLRCGARQEAAVQAGPPGAGGAPRPAHQRVEAAAALDQHAVARGALEIKGGAGDHGHLSGSRRPAAAASSSHVASPQAYCYICFVPNRCNPGLTPSVMRSLMPRSSSSCAPLAACSASYSRRSPCAGQQGPGGRGHSDGSAADGWQLATGTARSPLLAPAVGLQGWH
jgi:hypothetical protein